MQLRTAHVGWEPVRHFMCPELSLWCPELSEVQIQATSHNLEAHGVCVLLLLQCEADIEHAVMDATVSCM